jgi:hypothetical protein
MAGRGGINSVRRCWPWEWQLALECDAAIPHEHSLFFIVC